MEKLIVELQKHINKMNQSHNNKFLLDEQVLNNLHTIYPFNPFEYVISHLIATNTITIQQYLDMRSRYMKRNKYLHVFEITAPRTFGETWAQQHLNKVVPELCKGSTKFDPTYSGEYDFWYKGIKIEVKASRAVKRKSGSSLILKALSSNSKDGFNMNFQQLKPACCNVFVWIAVWKDKIRYWVLSSDEVKNNPYYSTGQHRGNTGEGQLWIKETNIKDFDQYAVTEKEILNKIIEKAQTS